MTEPTAPAAAPGPADALDVLAAEAAGGDGFVYSFTVGDRTGTLRKQTFGDLRAYGRAPDLLAKVDVLLTRCGDAVANELLDAMTPEAAMKIYADWESSGGSAIAAAGK